MAGQIELSDQRLSLEARAEWRDLRQDEYCTYAEYLESALALLGKRADTAGKYAREAFVRELKSIEAALEAVPPVEVERAALKAALKSATDATAAIQAAGDVDALLRARADAELKGRAVGVAWEAFKGAVSRARLPELGSFPLHAGRLQAFQAIEDLNWHSDRLGSYAPRTGRTFSESAAVDTAEGHARLELGALPWVIARTDPQSQTVKLWLFHVARRHKIGAEIGAPTWGELFPAEAAE